MAKILVVDDSAFMRMQCSKLFRQNGHEVVEAGTGVEAVEQYKSTSPDAVLLDITMPEMDGLNALREIRVVDADARVAMFTSISQQSIVMEALEAGAKDFITKPFDGDRLLAVIEKLIA